MNMSLKYIIIVLIFSLVFLMADWLMDLLSSIKQRQSISNNKADQETGNLPTNYDIARFEDKMKRLIPITSALGFILGFVMGGADPFIIKSYVLAISFGVLGFSGHKLILMLMKHKRKKKLECQLPDSLEIIVNSLKAGLSLGQALEIAAEETAQPINQELKKVVADLRLGLMAEDALERMWRRWPDPDLELFVVAAAVSNQTGANLAEVTSRLITTSRERFRLKGRIDALTAQGRLSGWVVGSLPILLMIALTWMEPDLMQGFFKHPIGLLLIGLCIILEGLGAFFIAKIATIKV